MLTLTLTLTPTPTLTLTRRRAWCLTLTLTLALTLALALTPNLFVDVAPRLVALAEAQVHTHYAADGARVRQERRLT